MGGWDARSCRAAASSQARAIWRKMSRSLSVLAVRAHPKHSFAFSRYSLAGGTTHVPVASLCDPKYCQVPSRSPALNPGRLAAPQLMVASIRRMRKMVIAATARRRSHRRLDLGLAHNTISRSSTTRSPASSEIARSSVNRRTRALGRRKAALFDRCCATAFAPINFRLRRSWSAVLRAKSSNGEEVDPSTVAELATPLRS